MNYIIYDKITKKVIKTICTSNPALIKLKENEAIYDKQVESLSQTDIRAYNEDGSVKSLGQQIKEKILELELNQVIKQGVVVELNPAYEDDKIKMIQRGLLDLDFSQKIEYDKENKKYYITEKSQQEKLIDGLISTADYNEQVISTRQSLYSQQLDGLRAELIESIINSLSEKGLLTEEQQSTFQSLLQLRINIKEKNPKMDLATLIKLKENKDNE